MSPPPREKRIAPIVPPRRNPASVALLNAPFVTPPAPSDAPVKTHTSASSDSSAVSSRNSRWRSAWFDVLAFALGLSAAWFFSWETTDLVWSLWLSSLVVGYAIILCTILRPLARLLLEVSREPAGLADRPGAAAAGFGIILFGALFMLAFFTVHFGGFHFVHSVFLNQFFPVTPGSASPRGGFVEASIYFEVLRRYWIFLPAAFLAERAAFMTSRTNNDTSADIAVTVEAIARRKADDAKRVGGPFAAPYKNVIRLHLLIFFFAGAHALKLDHFLMYAVVYAVYFFPWRLLRKH